MASTEVHVDWNRARAFFATAEAGSFSAAAQKLGLTQTTLSRQVAALEKELGIVLFARTGRGVALTPGGVDLLEYVRTMGAAADQLALVASGRSTSLEGNVAISATESTAVYILPRIVSKLRRIHPRIDVEIVATNTSSDLRRREADIAIRAFRPTQPDLVARRVADVHLRLYASDAYLESLPKPMTKRALAQADFIGVNDTRPFTAGLNAIGISVTAKNFPIITEHHIVHWALVKQGVGIGVLHDLVGDAEPGVSRVLEDLPPFVMETWLVSHRELQTNRRIRTVFDFLVAELAPAQPTTPLVSPPRGGI